MDDYVFCLKCAELRPRHEVTKSFHTGFVRVSGVDYPMGYCKMHTVERDKLSDSNQSNNLKRE